MTSILNAAFKAYENQDFEQARALIEKVPSNPEALYLKGLIHLELHENDLAAAVFEKALFNKMPAATKGTILYHKALAYKKMGNFKAANKDIESALTLVPNLKQAKVLHAQLLEPQKALPVFETLIHTYPDDKLLYVDLAEVYIKLKRHHDVVDLLEKAQAFLGEELPLHKAIASASMALERYETAYRHAKMMYEKDPESLEALSMLAKAALRTSHHSEALETYKKINAQEPQSLEALIGLAESHAALKEHDAAEVFFKEAIQMHTQSVIPYNNYGNYLKNQDRFDEAEKAYSKALEIDADHPDPLINLATLYKDLRQFQKCRALIDKALHAKPDYIKIHELIMVLNIETGRFEENITLFNGPYHHLLSKHDRTCLNYGFNCLAMGNFKDGWHYHDYRKHMNADYVNAFDRPKDAKDWQGEPLKDKIIFLSSEQGLGDEIMFASCFKEVVDEAKLTIIECDRRMRGILARSFPKAMFFPLQHRYNEDLKDTLKDYTWLKHLPAIDYICPIGSIARYTRPNLESYFTRNAFLKPDPARVKKMQARLDALSNRPKIGICWRSGYLSTLRNKYYTTIDDFKDIFAHRDVDFIVLQYNECSAEIEHAEKTFGVKLHHFKDINLKNDLESSLALKACLDLVITAPTSVGELAASVGTPTWRMESIIHWSGFGTKDQRPFFPSMRCFRSVEEAPWQTILHEMNAALTLFLQKNNSAHKK